MLEKEQGIQRRRVANSTTQAAPNHTTSQRPAIIIAEGGLMERLICHVVVQQTQANDLPLAKQSIDSPT